MKKKSILFKASFLFGLLSPNVIAAEYITPPEYDNLVSSVESIASVLISNTSPHLSTTRKSIGGRNVKYRCVLVSKIICRGAVPEVNLNISEMSLRDNSSDQLVNIYTQDTFSESHSATEWRVCGASLGGVQWDTSNFTMSTHPTTKVTTFDYDYVPNAQQETYWYFTDYTGNIGGANSFMVVETKQVCK